MTYDICKRGLAIVIAIISMMLASTYAQEIEAPNYAHIHHTISNSKSPNYYPMLMSKYIANDTTLSLEQYRHLYYGFSLQEDFVPYQKNSSQLLEIRQQLTQSKGNAELCPKAIEIAKSCLDNNPFDIPAIATIAIAYLQMGDTLSYSLWNTKQEGLLDAIISSGDGGSPESAFHVINIEHEYEVVQRLGLVVEKDSICSEDIEYLKVKENAEDEVGFYFNFGACSQIYRKKYK